VSDTQAIIVVTGLGSAVGSVVTSALRTAA